MPRPNRGRAIRAEANLAKRVAFERRARGWSLEGLAKRMTDAGCAIAGSAIYKIESGDPPRRVTVDELVALAAVFGFPNVDELLIPVELVLEQRAREVYERIAGSWDQLSRDVEAMLSALTDYLELKIDDPERGRLVHDLWFPDGEAFGPSDGGTVAVVNRDDGTQAYVDLAIVWSAFQDLLGAMVEGAGAVVAAGRGERDG